MLLEACYCEVYNVDVSIQKHVLSAMAMEECVLVLSCLVKTIVFLLRMCDVFFCLLTFKYKPIIYLRL